MTLIDPYPGSPMSEKDMALHYEASKCDAVGLVGSEVRQLIGELRHSRKSLETQAAEIARLRGLLGEAEAGLEDVINPLRKIQRDAAEQGARLSGMAYAVANDLHFVRDIARAALSKLRAEKENG